MHEYYFAVDVDDDRGVPFGPVNKDNMDVVRLLVDFTCWLDANEGVTELSHMMIKANPALPVPPWQANYPLDETSTILPTDLYPLTFVDQAVIHSGKAVALDLAAGTPLLSYAVSFTATAGVSRRRRLVDILMAIDKPLNPDMVALADTTPTFTYPLIINTSTNLPFGFRGRVYIDNTTAAPITVVLPGSPDLGDVVSFVDIGHTNLLYPVSFMAHESSPYINEPGTDAATNAWVSNMSGDDVAFEWAGGFWVINSNLFPILG